MVGSVVDVYRRLVVRVFGRSNERDSSAAFVVYAQMRARNVRGDDRTAVGHVRIRNYGDGPNETAEDDRP